MSTVQTSVDAVPAGTGLGEPQPRRYLIFGLVAIALFMASVDQTIVATALPTLQRELHAQVNWSSWTITIYALGQVLVMPLAGRISDQFGRKRVFVAAVALFTLTSLCCGLVSNIYELVALRGLQALGGGAFMPSATGIVSDQFGHQRDRAIGLFSSIFPIGGVVGPILGGVFVTYWSWRGIFLVNVPLGVLLLVLSIMLLPNGTRGRSGRLDLPGVALLGAGLLGVMLAISSLGSTSGSPLSVLFLTSLVLGVLALILFVRHSAHAVDPFVPLGLLRGRGFGVVNVINFIIGVAVLGFGALVPLYAEQRYGIATLGAGTLLTARAIGMIAVAGLATFALRRTGYRAPMLVGLVVAAASMILLAIGSPLASAYLWLAIGAGAFGVGLGVALPASNNAVLQLAPGSAASVAGLRGMFRQCGGITGISVVTAILARSADPGAAQAVAFVVFAVLLLLILPLIQLVPDHHGEW